MRKRTSKTLTLLASLTAVVTLGMATAALALAEPGHPPVIANRPIENPPDTIVDVDKPLEPLGPVDLEPTPDPDPVPDPADPDPTNPDSVVVLKPGQDPATVDAGGAFTGEAVYKQANDGEEKVVLIIAGRTVDERGNPIPGATVELVVDRYGMVRKARAVESRASAGFASEEKIRIDVEFPQVQGFSDSNGRFRLRVTYYANPGSSRDAWLHASRKGYIQGAISELDVSRDRDDVELELDTAANLTGRCVDQYGNPAVGVAVYAWGENVGAQGVTDENGRFVLEGLRGGDVQISCWSENHLLEGEEVFRIVAGQENDLGRDLRLMTRSSLDFRMDFAGAEDAEWLNGTVELYDDEGRLVFSGYFSGTKEGGYRAHAVIDDLRDGTWRMKVIVGGSKSWGAELTISVNKGMQNDLGTVYFTESDAAPPKFIEPCCG